LCYHRNGGTVTNVSNESVVGTNDGAATVIGTGASGNYSYVWVNPSGTVIGTMGAMSGLAPGTYSVTVRDVVDQNCVTVVSVIIGAGQPGTANNTRFIIGNISGATGSIVRLPISVVGFNDISAFDLSLNIPNTAMARFVPNSLIANSAIPSSQPILTPVQTDGNVELRWIGNTPLADNEVLFTIDVELLGGAGASVPISLGGIGGQAAELTVQPAGGSPVIVVPSISNGGIINGGVSISAQSSLQLGGRIIHPDGITAIDNATVNLSTGASTITNTVGTYLFNVAAGGPYTITPFEDTNFNGNGGVDLIDVQEIQAHIVRNDPLDNHFELIAADADRNGVIESRDLSHIIRTALLNVPFPENTSWRFIPTNFTFPTFVDFGDPVVALDTSITVSSLTADNLTQNFVGVKIGDVASNFATRGRNLANSSSRSAFQFVVKDQELNAGDLISVPVKSNNFREVVGYQMTLATAGTLELVNVLPGAIQDITTNNFGQATPESDISTLWVSAFPSQYKSEEVLFTLEFQVHTDGQLLSDVLAITSDKIEAYGLNKDFNTTSIGLVFEEVEVDVRVFDLGGRQVFTVENEFAKGYNEVRLESDVLPNTGVLYYEVEAANQIARRKMILIE